jgi:predicted anti-sigma-YlaC factor YlaD
MTDSGEKTEQTSPNGQGEGNRVVENDSSGSQPRVLPLKKKRGKLRTWVDRQGITTVRLWLYRRATLVGLGFLGLNAVDGYVTNVGHRMAVAVGVQQSIEANPLLQSMAGSWALSLKGIIALAVLGILARFNHFSPSTLYKWLLFGCIVLLAVIMFNLYSLRIIP